VTQQKGAFEGRIGGGDGLEIQAEAEVRAEQERHRLLAGLPQLGRLLEQEGIQRLLLDYPRSWVSDALRGLLAERRGRLKAGEEAEIWAVDSERWETKAREKLEDRERPRLVRVINATGVVLHTNLGRAPLGRLACDRLQDLAGAYTNLEFDLQRRERGSRQSLLESALCAVTGAEAALVVNNNAAAVMLMLQAMSAGREVILSRGELVEIGGSFRMPEVMEVAGVRLREVGTTNRTHLRDYEQAISAETGLLLKVHRSNFVIEGFVKEVEAEALVELGHRRGVSVMVDQGSGMLMEPPAHWGERGWSVRALHRAGVDVVTWSGDKLFGGPQCGVITGKAFWIKKAAKLPIARALRVDKLTLAALEATVQVYAYGDDVAWRDIPVLSALSTDAEALYEQAELWVQRWRDPLKRGGWSLSWEKAEARVGGGSLPALTLPTARLCLGSEVHSVSLFEGSLRARTIPIIGLLDRGCLWLDLRTWLSGDAEVVLCLFEEMAEAREGLQSHREKRPHREK